MAENKQSLRRGRLTRMPALLILLFAAVLTALAWFAVNSRAARASSSEEKAAESALTGAESKIERLKREGESFEIPEIPEVHPLTAMTEKVVELALPAPAKEDAYTAYTRLEAPEKAELPAPDPYFVKVRDSREGAFFKALSAGTRVELSALKELSPKETVSPAASSAALSPQEKSLYAAVESLNGLQQGALGNASPGAFGEVSGARTLTAYDALSQGDDFAHPYSPVAPDTPFMIRQGAVLPAQLVTGINSDLPGFVTAQVVEDVYDSVTGNYLLVPKGARLIGQYGSSPRLGQERLMLAFNRVIFPDGATLTLGAMPGASQDGFSGFEADVDNHLFRLITQAVLLGGISASVTISQDDDDGNDDSHDVGSAFSEALGMSLGTALTRVIENNMNISPTLTVDPGYSFNVVVAKDLRFKGPYRDVFR